MAPRPFADVEFVAAEARVTPQAAFTRVELLVVLTVVAMLALMLLPGLARTRADSRAFQCLNNVRELTRAWRMYCDDNQDWLPFAVSTQSAEAPYTWVTGTLDYYPNNQSNWNPDRDLKKSPL